MIVECPRCKGGVNSSPFAKESDPPCKLCEGAGVISDTVCRGCGRPSKKISHNGIHFCGRDECLTRLKGKKMLSVDPKKVVAPTYPYPERFVPAAGGGYELGSRVVIDRRRQIAREMLADTAGMDWGMGY